MLLQIIDSHTEGEPTRVVLNGPDLSGGTMQLRTRRLQEHFAQLVHAALETPYSECHVAAFLGDPINDDSDASVNFVNRTAALPMCVHGTIGVVRTLQHLGRVSEDPGTKVKLDTPAGMVTAFIKANREIAIDNVESRRIFKNVEVEIKKRTIHCDIAWSGNWFAICNDHGEEIDLENRRALTSFSKELRRCLNAEILDGSVIDAKAIDHVALFGPGPNDCDSRNFVLCSDGEFDRSPCGTATSAKIACLAADNSLKAGDCWIQESITGSRFKAFWRPATDPESVIPTITGRAWITGEKVLRLDLDEVRDSHSIENADPTPSRTCDRHETIQPRLRKVLSHRRVDVADVDHAITKPLDE